MAADFGVAEFMLTKHMNSQLLVYENPNYRGSYYLFRKKSTSGESTYFECRGYVHSFMFVIDVGITINSLTVAINSCIYAMQDVKVICIFL